jgi:hypothetical protein
MVPAPEAGAATVSVYEDVETTPWQPAMKKLMRIVRHSDAKRFLDVKGASPGELVLDVEVRTAVVSKRSYACVKHSSYRTCCSSSVAVDG